MGWEERGRPRILPSRCAVPAVPGDTLRAVRFGDDFTEHLKSRQEGLKLAAERAWSSSGSTLQG